jgi:hypothetical protein
VAGYAGLIAASALGGAVGMVTGLMPLGPLHDRLPWHSPTLAGLALAVVVGVPTTAAAVLSWRGDPHRQVVTTLAGVALVGWIAVEVPVVRMFSPLQPICAAAGVGLALLGDRSVLRRHPTAAEAAPHPDVDDVNAREGIDLYWLPLGAGGRCVRLNGRLYERLAAWHERRPTQAIYHAALEVRHAGTRWVVEMAPVWNDRSPDRGVVREGPVGARRLGRLRAFRYEVRCWPDGRIPDVDEAVDSPQRLACSPDEVGRLLTLVPEVPALTWGRDELHAGQMWNSNSLVAWLLAATGLDMTAIVPPEGGRAPGWDAGLHLARHPYPLFHQEAPAMVRGC